jgi:hypothetical protein
VVGLKTSRARINLNWSRPSDKPFLRTECSLSYHFIRMSTVFAQVRDFLNDRSLREQGRCPMLVVSSTEDFWSDAGSKFIGPNQSDDPNNPVYYVRSKEAFVPMDDKALGALVRLAPQHKPPQWLIGILTRVAPEETALSHEQNSWTLETFKSNIEVVTSVNPNPAPKKRNDAPQSPKKVQFADPIQQTAVIDPHDTKVIPQESAHQKDDTEKTPEPDASTANDLEPQPASPKKAPSPQPIQVAQEPQAVETPKPTPRPRPAPIPTPKQPSQPSPSARPMPRASQAPVNKAHPKHNQLPVQHTGQKEAEEEQPPANRAQQQKAVSTGFKVFGYEVSAPLAFALGTAAVAGGFYCWYKFGNAATKQPVKTPATQAAFAPQSPVFRTYYI